MKEWISQIWDRSQVLLDHESTTPAPEISEGWRGNVMKPYANCFKRKFWKPAAIRINGVYLLGYNEEMDQVVESLPKMPTLEAELLVDLLSKIFVYEPDQRLGVDEILSHPWLLMEE